MSSRDLVSRGMKLFTERKAITTLWQEIAENFYPQRADFTVTRYIGDLPRHVTIAVPILVGIVAGVVGSLLTRPPNREALERFLTKIYVPIGQEARLNWPLDEAVPPSQRWITAGGLFVVKPTRQSWVGFLVTLGICVLCVIVMLALLKG